MKTCPRCGIESGRLGQHRRACNRLPLPEELARFYRDNQEITYRRIAQDYGVDHRFIRRHLEIGGILPKELDERNALAIRHALTKKPRARPLSQDAPRCICGVVISAQEQLCRFCRAKKNGIHSYRDIQSAPLDVVRDLIMGG
jgi:hypothetical protein